LKKNIFIYFIILIIFAITVTGFFINQQVQKNYGIEVENNLIQLTKVLGSNVDSMNNDSSLDYNKLAGKYADLIGKPENYISPNLGQNTRVTFITRDGTVLGDSAADYHTMENHLNRKEVQTALQGETGIDTRYSNTLKVNYMYSAELIPSKNIIVRVSVPLINLQRIDRQIWLITVIGILMGLILAGILAMKFSSNIVTPIDRHIQKINKKLYDTVDDLKDKNIKMDAILNSMKNIIIAVDSDNRVTSFNSSASEFFASNNTGQITGRSIIELVRNYQINDFLTDTLQNNKINTGEIHISSPFDMILKITTAPIQSKDDDKLASGAILVMEDITNIKKLEQIKTEFVSNVTHELKTPLTSIKGFIETLKDGAIEDKEIAGQFLDIIDIEAERLTILINDILNLSEIETKQQDSNISKHQINEITDALIPVMENVAVKKNIHITWDIDKKIKVEVNKDRIKQLLINLIDNAVKYNIENGQIFVTIKRNTSGVEMSVRDTGIGIAEENLSRIFERFYRVDKGRSRSMGGTGLGLSIVKHIVHLYNGSIKINSTVGEGSEFIITLPV
jgi:Signal transduction histidine kinase